MFWPLTPSILGQALHSLERAITLLSVACPDITEQQLAMLSGGQSDRRLLPLRQMMIASRLDSLIACPKCKVGVARRRHHLEFVLNISGFLSGN